MTSPLPLEPDADDRAPGGLATHDRDAHDADPDAGVELADDRDAGVELADDRDAGVELADDRDAGVEVADDRDAGVEGAGDRDAGVEVAADDPDAEVAGPAEDEKGDETPGPLAGAEAEQVVEGALVVSPRRRPHSWLVLVTSMLLAALIPSLALLGGLTLIDSRDGRTILLEGASAVTVLPSTPAALVVHLAADGTVADLTMLAIGPSGNGGTVVLIPVATEASLPSGRVDRLDTAYAEGGLDELREAVEGVLNVRFDVVAVLDDEAWRTLGEATGPVSVDLLDPVLELGGPDQGVIERYPVGTVSVPPEEMGTFLSVRGVGESEIARLVRVQAFWEAWLGALTSQVDTTDGTLVTTTLPTADQGEVIDLGTFLDQIPAGPARFEVLPVTVPEAPSVDGLERYEPDVGRIRLLVAEVAPAAVTSRSGGPRVRVVDPVGDRALLETLVANLVFLGGNVVIASGSADDPPASTEITYYGEEMADAARSLAEFLGTDRVTASDEVLEGLDLTVVMGEDLAGRFPEPTTTTTAPVTPSTPTADPSEPTAPDQGGGDPG